MPNKMPNKNLQSCASCADKIRKMRELKRLRKLKNELLNINNWKTNITHSNIKDITQKCKRFSLKENGA